MALSELLTLPKLHSTCKHLSLPTQTSRPLHEGLLLLLIWSVSIKSLILFAISMGSTVTEKKHPPESQQVKERKTKAGIVNES